MTLVSSCPPPSCLSPSDSLPFCLASRHSGQGPILEVEDAPRNEALALADAIMWAKVNPFSPIHSGKRLLPY